MRHATQSRGFDDILRDVSSVEQIEEEMAQADQVAAGAEQYAQIPLAEIGPVGQALAPVLYLEKTDLMFWMLVIQTVLLFFIWRSR